MHLHCVRLKMTVQTQAERPFSEGAVTLIELLVAVLKACIENFIQHHLRAQVYQEH